MVKTFIQSASNARVKEIRKLRDRKNAKSSPFFYMEGSRIVGEAIACGDVIETLVVAPELIRNDFARGLIADAQRANIEIWELSAPAFESVSIKDHPQGIAALGRKRTYEFSDLNADGGIFLALNAVADPGNLGTIIRTADAVDCRGIILIGDSANPYDPNAVRASMGAIFSGKIVKSSYDEFLIWRNRYDIKLIGTSDSAEKDYLEIEIPNPVIIMMGSEREGLTERQLTDCDDVARIPMLRSSDSLNLAVASGVMIYQAYNMQRGYRLRK